MAEEEKKCACLECRIREAIDCQAGTEVDGKKLNEVLNALGNLAAEILAHVNTAQAHRYTKEVLRQRQVWMKDPRIAVQLQHKGSA